MLEAERSTPIVHISEKNSPLCIEYTLAWLADIVKQVGSDPGQMGIPTGI